jgi:hypothetical protein
LAQIVDSGANREPLEARFWEHAAKENEGIDYVTHKIPLLPHLDSSVHAATIRKMITFHQFPISIHY